MMDVLGKIRRWHLRDGLSIREIVKKTSLSRNTVRKYLRNEAELPDYSALRSPSKLDAYDAQLTQWLVHDQGLPRKQRRTAMRLFEGLKTEASPAPMIGSPPLSGNGTAKRAT